MNSTKELLYNTIEILDDKDINKVFEFAKNLKKEKGLFL